MIPSKLSLLALPVAPRAAAAAAVAGLLALALAAPAQATVFTDLQLSQLPADSAQYVLPGDAGEATLTVTELAANGVGTMSGSDLFGYQGLWLGGPGQGGGYRLGFSLPVASLRISFIALTALGANGEDGRETLGGFITDQPSLISFSSADASAGWDGATVTPLGEDGRGVLLFQAQGASFMVLSFDHSQAVPLNGVVINRIEYGPYVPEPATSLLSFAGLLYLLIRLKKRPPVQGALASQSCSFVSR